MRSLWKMTWVEAELFLREPVRAFFALVFPLIYLFLFGTISGNQPTPQFGGQRTIDASIPGLTAAIICMTGLMSTTMTMSAYRENGVLRRQDDQRADRRGPQAAQVIVIFGMTCLGMLLLIATGVLVHGVRFAGNGLSFLPAFVLSSLSFFGIGFLLAGTMPTVHSAWAVGMVLMYPMLLLSGAFFTVELLPAAVQKVAAFIPLKYVVDVLRGLWLSESWGQHATAVVVLAAMLVAGTFVSVKLFRWEWCHVTR